MNKGELIEEIQKKISDNCTKIEAERILNIILEGIKTGIKNDQLVSLTGFGSFLVKERSERNGVNPQTREKILIKASRTVGFKAGKNLKEIV